MSELAVGINSKQSLHISFFLWMTIAMGAVIFIGFGISYLQPLATGSLAPFAPIVHVHGIFYFAWMLLLMVQPLMIRQKNVALHRSIGLFGIAIGTGVIILGSIVTIVFTKRLVADSDPTIYGLMYISLLAVLGFGTLFFLAIKNIRDGASHKRYILLATNVLVMGGINRILATFGFGFDAEFVYLPRYLLVDLFVLAMLVYDWRTMGKLHKATLIGTAVNVIPQLLHAPIVGSATFVELTHWLGNLSG
jgi:hypothetical protein